MTHENVVLTSFPTAAVEEDYARAAVELEECLAELPGAVAVYKYGSITAPGISDLDRVAVVEGGRAAPDVWPRLSERTRYLVMHTPALVDPRTFARHRWLSELGDVELVWGTRVSIEQRPFPEYTEPVLAAEALVVAALKLAKLAVTGRVKVRSLLCELRNVRTDLRLARLERHDAPRAWSLADQVDRLREEWWRLDEADQRARVQHLLALAPDAIGEAINALGARAIEPQKPRSLPLRAQWRNVTVVPGGPLNGRSAAFRSVVGRSRRLGEARWRWVPRRLSLPPAVISLLAGPSPSQYEKFRVERDELVRRHAHFVASSPGYSGLSLASIFVE